MFGDLVQSVTGRIGAQIRAARRRQGRTLADLAGAAGLSEGFLSKLERGHAACSIANLIQLCAVLGINLSELFSDQDLAVRTRAQVHRGAAEESGEIQASGYCFRHLAGGAPQDELEVFHLVFPISEGMETAVSHPGQEHCFVLDGTIEFLVDGARHILAAGDGILIESSRPHLARNIGPTRARVLMTVTRNAPGAARSPDWWEVGAARS